MDRVRIAQRLLELAKELTAAWEPVRKDVDVGRRNVEMKKSLTSFAPKLSKILKERIADDLEARGYEVSARDLKREWSQYLTHHDVERNHNKYHYYAVYSFEGPNGEELFVGANCSGRIGIVERAYNLSKGAKTSQTAATADCEKHMRKKISHPRTPYTKVKMTRG
jgi:hypothetical protein